MFDARGSSKTSFISAWATKPKWKPKVTKTACIKSLNYLDCSEIDHKILIWRHVNKNKNLSKTHSVLSCCLCKAFMNLQHTLPGSQVKAFYDVFSEKDQFKPFLVIYKILNNLQRSRPDPEWTRVSTYSFEKNDIHPSTKMFRTLYSQTTAALLKYQTRCTANTETYFHSVPHGWRVNAISVEVNVLGRQSIEKHIKIFAIYIGLEHCRWRQCTFCSWLRSIFQQHISNVYGIWWNKVFLFYGTHFNICNPVWRLHVKLKTTV